MGVVETMDEQQLARLFPGRDDGNLYEGGYAADLVSGRADNFELKEEGDPASPADLEALIQAIDDAPADGVLDLLDAHFDRQALLRMWAVEIASSNVDAYSSLANNYFLYHPAEGEPWVMLPWGPDQSFLKDKPREVEVGVYDEPYGRLARDCRGDPACSAALDAALVEVLDLWDDIDLVPYVDDTTTRIGPPVAPTPAATMVTMAAATPRSPCGPGCEPAPTSCGRRCWPVRRPEPALRRAGQGWRW